MFIVVFIIRCALGLEDLQKCAKFACSGDTFSLEPNATEELEVGVCSFVGGSKRLLFNSIDCNQQEKVHSAEAHFSF